MPADRVCRVCLAGNLNLFCVRNELQNVYEKIAKEKYNNVGYPVHMCYICLTELRKCHRFMEVARFTNNVLKQWYKQQTEMRVAIPLYKYSISKVELISTTINKKVTLLNDIKVENVESEQEVQPDTPPIKKINSNETIPQHQVSETSGETGANNDTSNITPLSSTPSQPDNIRHRNLIFDSKQSKKETANLNKIVKTNVIQNKKKRRTRNTIKNRKSFNTLNTSIMKKHEINSNKVEQQRQTRSYTTNKPFSCDICCFKSAQKSYLKRHIMRIHTKEKPFLCVICNYKFTGKTDLVRHMRTHTGDKPFSCNVCNFKCTQKSNLKKHTLIHTKEKPFLCDICNYKFTGKGDLVRHIRTHTGDKPFSCNVCDFKSAQKSYLKKHTLIHTKEKTFLCDICNYKFTGKRDLVRHIRTHTGDKPFSCNVCNFKCTRKSYLKIHTRTHTNEKPFFCDVCDFKSAHKSCLKGHVLSKHAN